MPAPLKTKKCAHCSKNFITRVGALVNEICPICSKSDGVLKEYVLAKRKFKIKVPDYSGTLAPRYLGSYHELSVHDGDCIGIISKMTSNMLVARVQSGEAECVRVKMRQKNGNVSLYSVPYSEIVCIFKPHSHA